MRVITLSDPDKLNIIGEDFGRGWLAT